MQVKIFYDIHAFAEEQIRDDYFDRGACIHGQEIISLLNRKRGSFFVFKFDESTSLGDVISAIKRDLQVDVPELCRIPLRFGFLYQGERYYINDNNSSFSIAKQKYFAPKNEDTITACVLLSCDAGDVGYEYPLRFYVHSRESGSHSIPHIHVRDVGHQYEASISIETGEVIVGELPSKLSKIARREILSKQKYYFECWNTQTDGLSVDINHHLGIIQY